MRAVLTYHSVDPSGSPVSLTETTFREHVRWLGSGSVRVVPLDQILRCPDDEDAVAVTFDDGVASFGQIAAPLLLDAGLPVTVFVVSDRVGSNSAWRGAGDAGVPVFNLMSWSELGSLARDGVALGAHTLTHPDLTKLPPAAAEEEIVGSAERIEKETGVRPTTFAYPYGAYNDTCARIAGEAFDLSVTVELGGVPSQVDPHRLPRLDMFYYRDPGRLAAWGSPSFRRHLWLRQTGRRLRQRLMPAVHG